jgi:hypothetical protein
LQQLKNKELVFRENIVKKTGLQMDSAVTNFDTFFLEQLMEKSIAQNVFREPSTSQRWKLGYSAQYLRYGLNEQRFRP